MCVHTGKLPCAFSKPLLLVWGMGVGGGERALELDSLKALFSLYLPLSGFSGNKNEKIFLIVWQNI